MHDERKTAAKTIRTHPSVRVLAVLAAVLLLGVAVWYVQRDDSSRVTATAASTTEDPGAEEQADETTTTSSAEEATTTSSVEQPTDAGTPLTDVDWESLDYPVECGDQTIGTAAAYPEPEPGVQLAVVFVTCVAGAGSPPSAVLVYDSADSPTSAHLSQTLLRYEDNWTPVEDGTTADGPDLSVRTRGYSTGDVPRCCPDLDVTHTWTWDGQGYTPTTAARGGGTSHATLPPRDPE